MTSCPECGHETYVGRNAAGNSVELDSYPLGILYVSSLDQTLKPVTKELGRSVPRYRLHECPNPEEVDEAR